MLNSAGYVVFYAATMTREQALYCFCLARPAKGRFRSWEAVRDYYLDPIGTGVLWQSDHPFLALNTDQRDNAIEATEYFEVRGLSVTEMLRACDNAGSASARQSPQKRVGHRKSRKQAEK